MKKVVSAFLTLLMLFTVAFTFVGCNDNGSGKKSYTVRQDEYLFGIDNLTSDMQPAQIDSKTTNAWSAEVIGELGAKSHRIWIYLGFFVKRDNKNKRRREE